MIRARAGWQLGSSVLVSWLASLSAAAAQDAGGNQGAPSASIAVGEWIGSGQCEGHPNRITVADDQRSLTWADGDAPTFSEESNGVLTFTDGSLRVDIWPASQDQVVVGSRTDGYQCFALYRLGAPPAIEGPAAVDQREGGVTRDPTGTRQPDRPFGLLEVFGVRLGMSPAEVLERLALVHLGSQERGEGASVSYDPVGRSWGGAPSRGSLPSPLTDRMLFEMYWAPEGVHLSLSIHFVADTTGNPVAVHVYLSNGRRLDNIARRAMDERAQVRWDTNTAPDFRFWTDSADRAWIFDQERGDLSCLSGSTARTFVPEALGSTDCGSFVRATEETLLVADTTWVASQVGGIAPVVTADQPIEPGTWVRDPKDQDVLSYLVNGNTFQFNLTTSTFTAGFVFEVLSNCSLDLQGAARDEVVSFGQNGAAVAMMGSEWANADLDESVMSQWGGMTVFAAGGAAARAMGCNSPELNQVVDNITELLRFLREGDNETEDRHFMASCKVHHSEPQCLCAAQAGRVVDPFIFSTYFDDAMEGVTERNPLLATSMLVQCGLL